MAKVISVEEAAALVEDGMSVMVGGFLGCGNAHHVIDAIVARGAKDLTLICNDGGRPNWGVGKLVDNGCLRKLVATHVGLNPNVARLMASGELEVELVPQGSFIEMIRAGGAGLGGVLTPTGIGTLVAEGKQIVTVDGKDFLLEKPLRADVAVINGFNIDLNGNVWYKGTTRNFNVYMATAADTVIAEADHLVQVGYIQPEDVVTPGVCVDYIVNGGRL